MLQNVKMLQNFKLQLYNLQFEYIAIQYFQWIFNVFTMPLILAFTMAL